MAARRRRRIAALALFGALATLIARRRHVSVARVVELHDLTEKPGLGPAAIVINPSSGSARDLGLGDVRVRELADGEGLADVLGGLADEGVAVLGIAGGDGSVGCAAQVACDRDRALWVVPGGTHNHFARDLGLTTVDVAMESLSAGRVAAVDIGDVNGIGFVNNASLGVYGDLVRRREALERHIPKRLALLVATARTLRSARAMDIEVDGARRRAYLVFAGNNSYTGTGLTARESLQGGVLDVRVLAAEGRLPRLAALWAIAGARHGGSRWLIQSLRPQVTIRLDAPARLAHDGEVREVSGDVHFRSRPGALRVLVPPQEGCSARLVGSKSPNGAVTDSSSTTNEPGE